MGNTMTVAAFCKLLMDNRTVGLSMTILASGQLPMDRMAFGTGQGRMFCLVRQQQLVCLVMAAGTNLFGLGNRIGNLKRGVDWMAGKTGRRFQNHHGAVVFMAFSTLGDAPMFF